MLFSRTFKVSDSYFLNFVLFWVVFQNIELLRLFRISYFSLIDILLTVDFALFVDEKLKDLELIGTVCPKMIIPFAFLVLSIPVHYMLNKCTPLLIFLNYCKGTLPEMFKGCQNFVWYLYNCI